MRIGGRFVVVLKSFISLLWRRVGRDIIEHGKGYMVCLKFEDQNLQSLLEEMEVCCEMKKGEAELSTERRMEGDTNWDDD